MHVGVEFCIWDGKIGIERDGVDVVDVLSACLELGEILVKVSMDFVDVYIFLNCITCEFMEVCSELMVLLCWS